MGRGNAAADLRSDGCGLGWGVAGCEAAEGARGLDTTAAWPDMPLRAARSVGARKLPLQWPFWLVEVGGGSSGWGLGTAAARPDLTSQRCGPRAARVAGGYLDRGHLGWLGWRRSGGDSTQWCEAAQRVVHGGSTRLVFGWPRWQGALRCQGCLRVLLLPGVVMAARVPV